MRKDGEGDEESSSFDPSSLMDKLYLSVEERPPLVPRHHFSADAVANPSKNVARLFGPTLPPTWDFGGGVGSSQYSPFGSSQGSPSQSPVLSGRSGDRSSSEEVGEDHHPLDAFELPGASFRRQYSDSSLLAPTDEVGREGRTSGASDTHSPRLSPFFEPRPSSGIPIPIDRPLGPGRVPMSYSSSPPSSMYRTSLPSLGAIDDIIRVVGSYSSRCLFIRPRVPISETELVGVLERFGDIRNFFPEWQAFGMYFVSYYDIRHADIAVESLRSGWTGRVEVSYCLPLMFLASEKNQGTLVIFNLDPTMTNDELRDVFSKFGEVKDVRSTPHKNHQRFVEFFDVRHADAAIASMNKRDLNGRKIKIEPSHPGGSRKDQLESFQRCLQDHTDQLRGGGVHMRHAPAGVGMHEPTLRMDVGGGDRLHPSMLPAHGGHPHVVVLPDGTTYERTSPSSSPRGFPPGAYHVPAPTSQPTGYPTEGFVEPGWGIPPPRDGGVDMSGMAIPSYGGRSVPVPSTSFGLPLPIGTSSTQRSPRHDRGGAVGMDFGELPPSSLPPKPRMSGSPGSFAIDPERIAASLDTRSTIMIRNIPNKYTRDMLLEEISDEFATTFDFLYLPMDFHNMCNMGYAFLNMRHPKFILRFFDKFHGRKWNRFNSEKVCEITYGKFQGRDQFVEHFRRSNVMLQPESFRPLLFDQFGRPVCLLLLLLFSQWGPFNLTFLCSLL
eukprot:TRINITY_DN623_c0_g2_i1.p1 TRINITY_DN623_c0_g2~~TRINITY_DN623_c0_g2_i1.p1  ORF type:complete len:720 (-),score=169.99 TRINITY_DN623_c0_g2_i1:1055-3214(-)